MEPAPGLLCTPTSPLISSASRLTIESPSPVPPYWRAVEASACANGRKSFACCMGVKPMPVSRTEKRMRSFTGPRSRET